MRYHNAEKGVLFLSHTPNLGPVPGRGGGPMPKPKFVKFSRNTNPKIFFYKIRAERTY